MLRRRGQLPENGLVTPPVGLNVFDIANVVGKQVPVGRESAGMIRVLTADLVVLILLISVPIISLLIPMSMR